MDVINVILFVLDCILVLFSIAQFIVCVIELLRMSIKRKFDKHRIKRPFLLFIGGIVAYILISMYLSLLVTPWITVIK